MFFLLEIERIKILFTMVLCFVSFSIIYAQHVSGSKIITTSLSGILIDAETKTVLSNVTVQLQEKGNSQPIESILTNENGFFDLPLFPYKHYLVTFTYAG
jgi:hypothetical protein